MQHEALLYNVCGPILETYQKAPESLQQTQVRRHVEY